MVGDNNTSGRLSKLKLIELWFLKKYIFIRLGQKQLVRKSNVKWVDRKLQLKPAKNLFIEEETGVQTLLWFKRSIFNWFSANAKEVVETPGISGVASIPQFPSTYTNNKWHL